MVVNWPSGIKCPVVLSFDVDAELLWKVWLDTPPSIIDVSQGEYGPKVGLPRILDMLTRHGIKATFFTPGWVAEKYHEQIKRVSQEGHEIAHHGYLHEDCSKLTYEQEKDMIIRGSEALKRVTGKTPKGARLGIGSNTMKLLSELGFVYESTMMDDDEPYRVKSDRGEQKLVELPVTFAFNDTSYFAYTFGMAKPFLVPREVEGVYKDEFDCMYSENKYCMFMLHPQIIGRASRLAMLERTIEYMKSRQGVWFATALEVAEQFRSIS